ncbi:hypothetical protein GH714_009127 [Hevea brasiliensis]|uniref:Uncharacterized protein n=1 Tax=Hevea brasiliensis TaxID=3981 RepID=A0A6A6MT33_HEVBR|nr:hypothetical protein GH714_009127 [Hevea brasiliensis]
METKGGKKSSSSNSSVQYKVPPRYSIEDVLPNGGIEKFRSAAYSNILKLAESLSLIASDVKYSRGNFIFPNYQPAPDRSFSKEGSALKEFFECLNAEAYVLLGNPNHKWHIYSASRKDRTDMITVEMCQTSLDQKKAAVFFKRLADYSAKDLSRNSGISEILRSHVICDFVFDPCRHSMNGIRG